MFAVNPLFQNSLVCLDQMQAAVCTVHCSLVHRVLHLVHTFGRYIGAVAPYSLDHTMDHSHHPPETCPCRCVHRWLICTDFTARA